MSIALTQTDDSAVERFVANDDPATIIFTSGTTARPKGVVNTHLNWYSTLISALADLGINRTHKTLLALPMYHAGGLYTTFFALAIGGEGVILRTRSAPLILEAITTQKVNVVVLPATSWIALLQVPNLETLDLSSLQKLLVFQYLPRPAFNRWRELVPNAEWLNYWGQAEMIPLGSSTPPADLERKLVAPNPIGLPHLPLEIRVIDDDMRNLDPHEIGEFVARGPSVTPGYLGDPEANVALFHGGWHHTGDMGYSDEEGFLYFVDRKKDMIKTGGENVASQEVEEVIAQIPGVIEIAVVGVPDPYWIERVVAVVVSAKGAELSEESVISYVRKHLATFKVPKNVIFVDELPKNPTGKILKREIRKRFESV